MKNKKLSTVLFITVLTLLVVAEALTATILLRLKMLPDKYVIILAIALVLLAVVVGLCMFLPRKGRKVSATRRVIACVLALVLVCGCALVSKLAADAYATIQAITRLTPTVNLRNMYILVPIEDEAELLCDTAGYNFGYIEDYNHEQTEYAFSQIESFTVEAPARTGYTSFIGVADAILNGEVDAVMLNGISVTLLLEEDGYEDLFLHVRVLKIIPHTEKDFVTQPGETQEQDVTNTPFAVYISGTDTRSGVAYSSRSDVNILMIVNPETKQVLLVNTPRDYYVSNSAGKGSKDKLTHLSLYGVECSINALEELYDIEIQYYAKINYTGFEKVVDAVGGITIYSEEAFVTKIGKTQIYVGENRLDGVRALNYARERKSVTGGDNGRGKNQMKVITAIMKKATSGTTIISNYSAILDSLAGLFTTNFEMSEISNLVKMQLNDMASWDVRSYAVTGTGGYDITYSVPGMELYVMRPDEESVQHGQTLINKVFAGEILTDADLNP